MQQDQVIITHLALFSLYAIFYYLKLAYSPLLSTITCAHSISDYFRALLYGGMKESKLEEIELRDTQLQPFRHLLRYIYTGQMSLSSQKDEMILEILGLAHQYGFIDLETSISDYLRLTLLDIRNVSLIYDTASLYQLETLVNACCSFMDRNASDVIKHESLTSKLSN